MEDVHIAPTEPCHCLREAACLFVRIERVEAPGQIANMPAVHFVFLTFGNHEQFSPPSSVDELVGSKDARRPQPLFPFAHLLARQKSGVR